MCCPSARERIAAALAQLEAGRQAAEAQREELARQYLEGLAAGTPPRGHPPAEAEMAVAEENLARAQAKREQKAAASNGPGPVANITDPDSHLMPVRGGGFIQGFNAQAAHSAGGLCLGGLVTRQTTDYACFGPLLDQVAAPQDILRAHARGPLKRLKARTGIVLADAGYLSDANLTCQGPDRLIATGTRRGLNQAAAGQADPGRRADGRALGDAAAAMAARLATPHWRAAYKQRGPIAEGPFGNRKHNHWYRAFSTRGLGRVSGEWTFQNTIENLLKIHSIGWQPA